MGMGKFLIGLKKKVSEIWQKLCLLVKSDGSLMGDKQPPYANCLNCGTELKGMYCHKCGQEATLPVPKMSAFIKEYLKNLLCLERKAIPTLINLVFKPGRLMKEYCAGHYASYLNPLKLNLFFLFILITLFAIFGSDSKIKDSVVDATNEDVFISDMALSTICDDEEYLSNVLASRRDTINLVASLATLEKYGNIIEVVEVVGRGEDITPDSLVAVVPSLLKDDKILVKEDGHYQFSLEDNRLDVAVMTDKVLDMWEIFVSTIFNHFPLLMLLTSPFLAFIIRMVVMKKLPRSYFYIFALFYMAFVEMTLAVLYVFGKIFNFEYNNVKIVLYLILFAYLSIALKQTYELRSWIRTMFSALVINVTYLLCCFIFISVICLVILIIVMV